MASRSATVLVIFVIAIMAFCLASVFAAMTGPINILPDNSGSVLDNLSAITDSPNGGYDTIGYQDYNDYSTNDYSTDSSDQQSDDSQNQVDTYTEPSQPEQPDSGQGSGSSDSGSSSSDSGSGSNQNGEPNG